MRRVSGLAAVVLLVLTAAPASAFHWSLGANLGYTLVMPTASGSENTNVFAWPNQLGIPGLRIGFTGENPQHELYFDTGLVLVSTTDVGSSRSFVTTVNYQYNLASSGSNSIFLTAGGGFLLVGQKDDIPPTSDLSATAGLFGGGVGVRHKMGNGHGTMRAEVRFDKSMEGKDGAVVLLDEANLVALKLGFDLWE